MPDDRPLTPADPSDLAQALAHALRFDGRRRLHQGDEFMAKLMAEHLARCLEAGGFVVMRRPPGHGASYSPGLDRRKNP